MPVAHEVILHMDVVLLLMRTISGEDVQVSLATEYEESKGVNQLSFRPVSTASSLAQDLFNDIPALMHLRVEGLRTLQNEFPSFSASLEDQVEGAMRLAVSAGWGESFTNWKVHRRTADNCKRRERIAAPESLHRENSRHTSA